MAVIAFQEHPINTHMYTNYASKMSLWESKNKKIIMIGEIANYEYCLDL